jgi:prefoldin subunit 5
MTKELVEQKMELTQKELQARVAEFQGLQKRAEELQATVHNLKVQIATYQDLLADNTDDASEAVKETMETLISE